MDKIIFIIGIAFAATILLEIKLVKAEVNEYYDANYDELIKLDVLKQDDQEEEIPDDGEKPVDHIILEEDPVSENPYKDEKEEVENNCNEKCTEEVFDLDKWLSAGRNKKLKKARKN